MQQNFAWTPGLLQYDSVVVRTNTWYAPGRLETQENVYFTQPYPTRSANSSRLRNYYTTGGLLYREDFLQYDRATAGYKVTRSNLYSFTPAAKVAEKRTYAADTTVVRYFYNAAGQLSADSSYLLKAAAGGLSAVDEIHSYSYLSSTATAYATMKHYFNIAPGIRLFDSIAQSFDGNGSLIFRGEYHFNPNNGDPGDFFTRSVSYNAAGRPVNVLQQEFYVGSDTAAYFTGLTYNAAGNPATRISIWTDAYGNPAPDTFQNIYEGYNYEAYVMPKDTIRTTGIGSNIIATAQMNLFPNPAAGALHISCQAMETAGLTIAGSNGQLVRNYEILLGNNAAIADVSGLAPGTYFVTLRDARTGIQTSMPFVKQWRFNPAKQTFKPTPQTSALSSQN